MSIFEWSVCQAKCQNNRNLRPMLLWHTGQGGADGKIISELAVLYKMTEEDTQNTINWYLDKKRWKSRMSQWLRALAILFGALGTLCPVWPADIKIFDIETVKVGYVLYAVAASFLATDKFFGFSSSWMRMIQTELRIST